MMLTLLMTGCSRYQAVGVREVKKPPVKIGIVEEKFIKYFPLRLSNVPNNNSNALTISVKKQIGQKVVYHSQIHDETIYEREAGPIEDEAVRVERHFDANPIAGILELALAPLKILLDYHPAVYKKHKQRKYEKVPNSERYSSSFKENLVTKPETNARLILEGYGYRRTNVNGEVTFRVTPSMFDNGVKLNMVDNNQVYIIKREKVIRKYKADWYPSAKLISDLATIGVVAYKVRRVVVLGGGPYAIAGAILVEAASGLIIGFVIEIASNKSQEYYHWSLVRISS